MLNTQISALPDYPFDRLRHLLRGLDPPKGKKPIIMSVGEPQIKPPGFIADILSQHTADWGKYPPIDGSNSFRRAVADWLLERYNLNDQDIEPDTMILPVAGTREALFLITVLGVPRRKKGMRPAVAMPNPFYHVYGGAAAISGAEPLLLSAGPESCFLPNIGALDRALLERIAVYFFCSPANPQGTAAKMSDLVQAIELARRHDFILIVDECYSEIYNKHPPVGALQAAKAIGEGFKNLLVFHSLSKRSSAPGLRSGIVAGDPELIQSFRQLRSYVGPQTPLPILAVAEALWKDRDHVEKIRAFYRKNFNVAESILKQKFGFYHPDGGFFLWLKVGDGELVTKKLWSEAGVKVLPGAFIGRPNSDGINPGSSFIRVALVNSESITERAINAIVKVI